MLIKVSGAAVQGIDAYIVTIEASTSRGIRFFLVGLPDSAVKESHERIISAFHVNGYKFPSSQIIINMAPADIRKEGAAYDLPLAVGILAVNFLPRSFFPSLKVLDIEIGLRTPDRKDAALRKRVDKEFTVWRYSRKERGTLLSSRVDDNFRRTKSSRRFVESHLIDAVSQFSRVFYHLLKAF